ncbi:GAF domain-containing protein [Conexibacter sp. W3-3-2]|uniref:LuxR C-terminal-related transcriptional regulator n=1 Tax=Conexibacter sp. W3-3-2 TaxID=2675227 RepID=UPI0012B8184F|nr:LuxR C-terminal-related transcriptional regulator [Conexibacter sp. W3-3-2]MTD45939.1 GAF domain-containing protein [Conexibacter sp. W3-3-2]
MTRRRSDGHEAEVSADAARELLARVDALLDGDESDARAELGVEQALQLAEGRLLAAVRATSANARTDDLASVLSEVFEARDTVRQASVQRRLEASDRVRRALSELRSAPTAAAVMDRAVKVLCTHCGFDRAFLFRVEDAEMVCESIHYVERPEWAQEFFDLAQVERPQLTHQLLETEMIRRRAPVIIQSPATDPRTFKPLVLPVQTTSYVAAPVMPDDKVIGFLHADCFFQGREVDEVDRDTLWAFAEGFGFAVDRALLLERLNAQREEVSRLVTTTHQVLNALTDAELRITRAAPDSVRLSGAAASALLPLTPAPTGSLLTPREHEVVALMAEGATNAAIARRLVVSEATVKSHVKNVFGKLRASNRAEAVAKYRRIHGEAVG